MVSPSTEAEALSLHAERATAGVPPAAHSSSPSSRHGEPAWDRSRRLRMRSTGVAVAGISARLARSWRTIAELLLGWSREPRRAAARHEVVAMLARRLAVCADPAAVMDEAWLAITQLCRLTPGLRVLAVTTSGASWRVTRACGELVSTPMGASAPLPIAPAEPIMVERPLIEAYAFDRAAGQRCSWVALSVPATTPAAWLILGTPTTPQKAATSLRAIAGLVSLALRRGGADHTPSPRHDDAPPQGVQDAAPAPAASVSDAGNHQMPQALPDLDRVTDAVRRAGEQVLQQLSLLVQQHDSPGAEGSGNQQVARLTSDMIDDISHAVTERVTAALIGSGAIEHGSPATPAHHPDEREHDVQPTGRGAREPGSSAAPKSGDEVAAKTFNLQRHPAPLATEDMQAAVDADEIVMRYQPILSTSGDQCIGVEALPRWQHPDQGLLNPPQFLNDDRAGREGVRIIGAHVLRQAVSEGSRWRQQFPGRHIPVHVNVSAHQLDDHAFAGTVRDCLHQTSLPAQSLVLEVTDNPTALSPTARAQLHDVAADGVLIAVSLDQPVETDRGDQHTSGWRDLPVNIIKLDGTAAPETQANSGNRSETLIEMAQRLGLRTVAQRVEDSRQRDRLRDAGADSTQGYLHAPPLTADALTDWLHDQSPSGPVDHRAQTIPVLAGQGAT